MRIDIQRQITLIPLQTQSLIDFHILRCRLLIIARRDIILGAGVPESNQQRRQLRHRVVVVRHSVRLSMSSGRDIVCERLLADFGGAIGVEINVKALAA